MIIPDTLYFFTLLELLTIPADNLKNKQNKHNLIYKK